MERVRHSQDVYFTGNKEIGTTEEEEGEEGELGGRLRRPWGEIGKVMEQVTVEGSI